MKKLVKLFMIVVLLMGVVLTLVCLTQLVLIPVGILTGIMTGMFYLAFPYRS